MKKIISFISKIWCLFWMTVFRCFKFIWYSMWAIGMALFLGSIITGIILLINLWLENYSWYPLKTKDIAIYIWFAAMTLAYCGSMKFLYENGIGGEGGFE